MDDAHLAEHCLHSLYSVEIDKFKHATLFKDIVTELYERFPEYSVLADSIADDAPPTPPELLSFVDQVAMDNRIREIIDSSSYLTKDDDLKFRWNRIRNSLREANFYIGINSIWIRPYVYPLISNAHYEQASQRLYVSATIGDPSDLSRRLGVKKIVKIPVPPRYAEKTFGRRLVIMNRIEDKDLPVRLQAAILTVLRIHPKSVWLCSSTAEAAKFKDIVLKWLDENGLAGHPSWILTSLGDEIDQFKKSSQGHLFVAGRFDGMDFTTNECQLVVVTTLPRSINLQEEFISAYLRDSGFMKRRLNQRIIQAVGRCNRSDDDFGIYVLADRRFATHFGPESNRVGIPRNIVAEIDIAQDAAESSEDELIESVKDFLGGHFDKYDAQVKSYLAEVPNQSPDDVNYDTSNDEVVGWTALFQSHNYRVATNHFESCWKDALKANLLEIGALHGWHWAKALYLESTLGEPSALQRSFRVLEEAIGRGGRSAWFNRMRASLNRAKNVSATTRESTNEDYSSAIVRAYDDLLERLGATGNKFERWSQALTSKLESNSHQQFTEGLEQLGRILGYSVSRPRHGAATDCRWRGVHGNIKELITFEDKIEDTPSSEIIASDVGQAHNQENRAKGEYEPFGYTVRGTIVTHLTTIRPDAESSAGTIRVIEKDGILELWNRTRTLLSLYRDNWSLDDLSARLAAAETIRPRFPPAGWLIRVLDGTKRTISAVHLLTEWS